MGNGHGWTLERWLLVVSSAFTAIALVFGMGVQWNETTHVKASQAALAESIQRDYVRSDVYAADRRELSAAIDRLTRALEQQQERDERRPPSPVFGR